MSSAIEKPPIQHKSKFNRFWRRLHILVFHVFLIDMKHDMVESWNKNLYIYTNVPEHSGISLIIPYKLLTRDGHTMITITTS